MRARRRDERGATALLVAVVAIVLFGAAALAVDYSSLAMERQQLHDNIDAAAHAGAYELPADGTKAVLQANGLAKTLDPSLTPDVDMFCVVASKGSPPTVRTDQVPATCDPGAIAGQKCNTKICMIPCVPAEGDVCNAVRVSDTKTVPFGFAKIIGFDTGSTGSVTSLACKGSCGNEMPNPMNVVFMADRTPSMSTTDRVSMKNAILESLKTMTPSLHYVAFGALHKSIGSGTCRTEEYTASSTGGDWIPLDFSRDYLTSAATPTLNTASELYKGINCLPASDSGGYGTHLASSFKGAARYLNGDADDNLSSLPSRPGAAPTKVLIFETDGMPDEVLGNGYKGMGDSSDFGAGYNGSCQGGDYYSSSYSVPSLRNWCKNYQYNTTSGNGEKGCENLVKVANEAKAKGIVVITVGFGQAATGGCTVTRKHNKGDASIPWQTGGTPVRNVLAQAASKHPLTGDPTVAGDCASASGRSAENTDGDYFFCAVSGAEMADIFKIAVQQVSTSIRFLQIPS